MSDSCYLFITLRFVFLMGLVRICSLSSLRWRWVLVDFFPSFLSFFFFLSIEDSMFFLRERKQREMTFLKAPPNFDKMSFFPYDFKARSLKFENTSYD